MVLERTMLAVAVEVASAARMVLENNGFVLERNGYGVRELTVIVLERTVLAVAVAVAGAARMVSNTRRSAQAYRRNVTCM
jgi:hypothetical protein